MQSFEDNAVLAIYPQNLLKNVKPGDAVEIAFQASTSPNCGRQGQGGQWNIPARASSRPARYCRQRQMSGRKGTLAVLITLDDEELAKELPLGAAGTTAIYTDYAQPFHIITKITVRIKAWMYQCSLPV